jgi:hypothetical protein
MKFRTDSAGHIKPIWNHEQLRRMRMLIRTGIPLPLWTIEERLLIDLCEAKCKKHDAEEFFEAWYYEHCEEEREYFLKSLRTFAVQIGIKHWRLRQEDE